VTEIRELCAARLGYVEREPGDGLGRMVLDLL
jgi:hypothetical protein